MEKSSEQEPPGTHPPSNAALHPPHNTPSQASDLNHLTEKISSTAISSSQDSFATQIKPVEKPSANNQPSLGATNPQGGLSHPHHHNCQHQHQSQNPHHMIMAMMGASDDKAKRHQHHQHHHHGNCNHQHLPTCKFYVNQQFKAPEVVAQLPKNLNIKAGIAEALLKYLRGNLHKTWAILEKLEKAKLVDNKLEGVFILKELGLNKGTAPLKCLTANNGDIPKTLNDLLPKQPDQTIQYISSIPEQEHIMYIDGLSLATCDEETKKMCLSNTIQQRHKAIIRMYMLIEIASGLFFIPREYVTPQVMQRIKNTVASLKTKSKHPFKLRLAPIQGTVDDQLSRILKISKAEQLKKIILVSQDKELLGKKIKEYPQLRAMQGQVLFQQVAKSQDKEYTNQLISLK